MRDTVALGLDSQHVVWLRNGSDSAPAVATGAHQGGVAVALAGVGRGTTVDIIVANDVALHWLQMAPASVASFAELRLVAGARCARLYGGSTQDWWVAGDWRLDRAFACATLPQALVTAMATQLEALGARARWHTAWGLLCGARSRAFPSDGWCAMRSPSRIVLWHCRSGNANCLSTLAIDAQASDGQVAEQALQQMQVEASRSDDAPSSTLHWLSFGAHDSDPLPAQLQRIAVPLAAYPTEPTTDGTLALHLACLLEGRAA